MRHILILRRLSEKEAVLIRSLTERHETVVLADPDLNHSYDFAKPLQKLNEVEKRRVNYQTLQDILEFGDDLIDGKPVSQHLNFHGAGLWYYHKFRIYFKIRNRNYLIAEINKNIKEATSVIIFTSNIELDVNMFNVEDCKIQTKEEKVGQRISIGSMLSYGIAVIFRFSKSIFGTSANLKIKRYLCIDTSDQYRDILSLDGSKKIVENAYLGYLYQAKGWEIGFVDQLLIPKFKGADRFRFSRKVLKNHNMRSRIYGEKIIGSYVLSLRGLRQISNIRKDLDDTYHYLGEHLQFNIRAREILNEFRKLHVTSMFYLFKFFAYTHYFQKNKFASIITTDENSPNFKIILDAARKNGMRTIGYQHGSIHELHPAYIYSKSDIEHNPIPDLTITWGKKWKQLLIEKGNYPPDRVGVAGQLRTDVISNLGYNQNINKKAVFGQQERKRIILFATQPQRDPALRCKAAEDVVKACCKIENALLVFKLHPRENDPHFYENIARAHGLVNYAISKDEELYVLLHLADVVITCFSTVGSEALYFKKPLIILDHLRQDILKYHHDGVAWQATDASELAHLIAGIFDGQLEVDKQRLEDYLIDSTYAIDGKVSERVWNYLNKGS